MEVKIIKDIKKWVLFNILKGRAHLLRIKHFLKTGRDIEMLPPPQKEYTRVYFFEIENGEKIDFVQNRLILFDAKNYHRGIGPRTNVTRMTFALKTKKI